MRHDKYRRIVKKKQKALSIFYKTIRSLKDALDEVSNARTTAIENRQNLRNYLEQETASVNKMIAEENKNIDFLFNEFKELEVNIANLSGLFSTPLPQEAGAPKDVTVHDVPPLPKGEKSKK